jgi:hypothetical protein
MDKKRLKTQISYVYTMDNKKPTMTGQIMGIIKFRNLGNNTILQEQELVEAAEPVPFESTRPF